MNLANLLIGILFSRVSMREKELGRNIPLQIYQEMEVQGCLDAHLQLIIHNLMHLIRILP